MIKTKTVTLKGNDLVRSLERTQYEMEAHKDLLAWMINNKYDITASAYQKYHSEYTDLFTQYQKLKYQFMCAQIFLLIIKLILGIQIIKLKF